MFVTARAEIVQRGAGRWEIEKYIYVKANTIEMWRGIGIIELSKNYEN